MILWHPVQDILVSCSYDDTIRIWKESEDDWYSSAVLSGHSSTVWAVDFDPTGNYIDIEFSTDNDWECIFTVPAGAHSRAIYSISWRSGDNSICIFKVTSQLLPKKTETVKPTLSKDSYITLSEFNLVKMNVELVTKVENAHSSNDVNSVSWNPNPDYSGFLSSAGDDDNSRIWYFEKK
ncbi:putative cytosolic iron-sulfur protein assembly protein CIAO1 [Smittium culicis]|uniref:Putative cytosolic iron-sulfur protein assembly protein CIAO1 n=1 Tax=Smittium culicis TaxID=133412 RepID=A0A1R1XL12_9FUNG|nr:putative cytosolic iron-sulfur protein assembly protein CIAO1 [Smittium culicis]